MIGRQTLNFYVLPHSYTDEGNFTGLCNAILFGHIFSICKLALFLNASMQSHFHGHNQGLSYELHNWNLVVGN
jgi:hypothetical protein